MSFETGCMLMFVFLATAPGGNRRDTLPSAERKEPPSFPTCFSVLVPDSFPAVVMRATGFTVEGGCALLMNVISTQVVISNIFMIKFWEGSVAVFPVNGKCVH